MEDALSDSHRSLAHLGIEFGQILRQFNVFNVSIASLPTSPYSSFDLTPILGVALKIYPHFDRIVTLLIRLNSSLHDFSKIVRSAFQYLTFSHAVSTSPGHSSQRDALLSLDFSIVQALRQIHGHITAVLSLSLPDMSGCHYAKDHVGHRWDAFCGMLLDLQVAFEDCTKKFKTLLPQARQLVDQCMSVAARPSFRVTNTATGIVCLSRVRSCTVISRSRSASNPPLITKNRLCLDPTTRSYPRRHTCTCMSRLDALLTSSHCFIQSVISLVISSVDHSSYCPSCILHHQVIPCLPIS